jgi:hypothetical protein
VIGETSLALERLDDAGFEVLATSVLRRHSPEYASILHTGVNAEGKPIASPLDGFCRILHSDPPHFLLVEHTTTKPKGLAKKWLHDHTRVVIRKSLEERKSKLPSESDDGDLLKAGREAAKTRQSCPNAVFTVVLTTNRSVSHDLLAQVYEKADELEVAVDIWEQSRIVDMLDIDPEGQYIRQQYLGIEAERLSESLLRELAELSSELHRHHFATKQGYLQSEITRDSHSQLLDLITRSDASLIGLLGASGMGKSTLLRQVGQDVNAGGGVAIWVPAEHIQFGTSVDYLLLRVRKSTTSRKRV